MKKNILLVIVTAIVFTGIGAFAAIQYQANEIGYGNGTVKDAIDDLYTTANTTVTGLEDQIDDKNSTISTLEGQISSLQQSNTDLEAVANKASSFSFTVKSTPTTFNLGFRPNYISCILLHSDGRYFSWNYNKDFNNNRIMRLTSEKADGTCITSEASMRVFDNIMTITDTGFSWDLTSSDWIGVTIYCTASR